MVVKQVASTIDPIIYQVLELKAEQMGKSVSELVREAIYEKINLTNDPMAVAKMMVELHELKKPKQTTIEDVKVNTEPPKETSKPQTKAAKKSTTTSK